METIKNFNVGDYAILISTQSSVQDGIIGTHYKCRGKSSGSLVKILKIDNRFGSASQTDPRYYGHGFNVRGKDLRKLTLEEKIHFNLIKQDSYDIY